MRLAHVNDAFCALVGLQAEELLGTGWMSTVHPDDLEAVIEEAAAVLTGGEDAAEGQAQARLVRADGTEATTVIRFARLFTPGVGAGFVGTIEDITERLAFEARLAHQATHDPLTGLPNRTLLAEHVAERLAGPATGRLGVLFLDLDHFKVVNDSLGHEAGDELLRRGRPTGCAPRCAPATLVARFGGDEFVVVCQDVDEDRRGGRWPSASRPRCAARSPLGGVRACGRTASVGVAVQTAEHRAAEDADPRRRHRHVPGQGRAARAGSTVFDADARAEARRQAATGAELREALERGEFDLLLPADRRHPARRGPSASRRSSAGSTPSAALSRPAVHRRSPRRAA